MAESDSVSNYHISDTELYHIAVYRSPAKDHKYITREWKNGRWNYVYENTSPNNNKKDKLRSGSDVKGRFDEKSAPKTHIPDNKPANAIDTTKEFSDKIVNRGKTFVNLTFKNYKADEDEWSDDLNNKAREYTQNEDQDAVNPKYNPFKLDYSMNCAYCTAAYDLRRRGYDVEAMPYDDTYSANVYSIAEWYENTTIDDWESTTDVRSFKSTVEKNPEGSYGQFVVYWRGGGGHSMVWEKQNGKVVIRDCQVDKTYLYEQWALVHGRKATEIHTLRTDNREPSEKIRKTVRNKNGGK